VNGHPAAGLRMKRISHAFCVCAPVMGIAKPACAQALAGDALSVSGVYEAYYYGTKTNDETGAFSANALANGYQVGYVWNISPADLSAFQPSDVVTEATHVFNRIGTYCLDGSHSGMIAEIREGECQPAADENFLVWLGFFSQHFLRPGRPSRNPARWSANRYLRWALRVIGGSCFEV